jgi:hypothetical protein
MRAFGASPDSLAQYRARLIEQAESNAVHIFPENWHATSVFLAMGSQWRIESGWGGRVYHGLDYAALPPVLAEHRRIVHRQPMDVLMPQLRTLEMAARDVLNQD